MTDLAVAAVTPLSRRNTPAHQVLTLFGDYWWEAPEPLPTGALIAGLTDLGVKEPAARAALARLVSQGLLETTKVGRRTAHALSAHGDAVVRDEGSWLAAFGSHESVWDGLWSVIVFTVPETVRSQRHEARSRLRWLGYAPLYDGVWISPSDTLARAEQALAEAGVSDVTTARASLHMSDPAGPLRAWELDAVRHSYAEFLRRADAVEPDLDPRQALVTRVGLMLSWQTFRQSDPDHPAEILPPDWPRRGARSRFAETYNRLGDAAEMRMREHVERIAPELVDHVSSQRLRTDGLHVA